jgi:Tfp pilus assembly protein PilN
MAAADKADKAAEKAAGKEKKPAKKRMKGKIPSKQTLNLVYKEKDTGRRVFVVLAIVLFILALAAFGWFIVRVQLSKVAKARNKYESLQQELTVLKNTASQYDNIVEEYSHYGKSYMNAEEIALQNRMQILATIQGMINPSQRLTQIQLTGNTATVGVMTRQFEEISTIVRDLEANPIVLYVTVNTASMDEKGRLARKAGSLVETILTIEFRGLASYDEATQDDGEGLMNSLASRKAALEAMGEE